MYQQNYNYYPQQTQNPQIVQQQPMYQNPYLRPAPQQTGLKGRLVASLEEARASSIDFDGSIFYFPDLANCRIYTKQINMDGTATLNVYELREIPIERESAVETSMEQFVTREEFERVLAQFRQSLATPIVPAPQEKPEVLPF